MANMNDAESSETATHHDSDGDFVFLALVGLDAKEGLAGVETTDTSRAYTQTSDVNKRLGGSRVQVERTDVG